MNGAVAAVPAAAARSRALDYVALAKPRLSGLVVVTTLLGFVVASPGPLDALLLIQTLLGTALAAAGAAALNMVLERDADAKMRRTAGRPIPAGRLSVAEGWWFGALASVAGCAILASVNLLTAAIGAATIVSYAFVYTPLKARTSLSTVVGAIPGALPPVMGWTAAADSLGPGAVALFAILFFWQLPHFLAIAWMYREDYARAGYPMLPVAEPDGASTARQVVVQSMACLVATLLPLAFGLAGPVYAVGAPLLGVAFVALGVRFAAARSTAAAHALFVGSIVYLPLLLGLLAAA